MTTLRRASPLLLLLFLISGCATKEFITGTASIAASPAMPGAGGAAPQQALVCSYPDQSGLLYVDLSPGCLLRVRVMSSKYETSATVNPVGACVVRTGEGAALHLEVTTATGRFDASGLDVTLGGTGPEGRYVTYRFTGPRGRPADDAACASVTDQAKADVAALRHGE